MLTTAVRKTVWGKMRMYGTVLMLTASMVLGGMGLEGAKTYAAGSNYYVSPTGSDSNSGTSTSQAWKTLQHAADSAGAGDTVYVMGGVYQQKLKITHSGSAVEGPITFKSYDPQTAILDGTGLSVADSEGLVEITDASHIVLEDFEIRNFKTTTKDKVPSGILITGAGSNITIRNNYIHTIENNAACAAICPGAMRMGLRYMARRRPSRLAIFRFSAIH